MSRGCNDPGQQCLLKLIGRDIQELGNDLDNVPVPDLTLLILIKHELNVSKVKNSCNDAPDRVHGLGGEVQGLEGALDGVVLMSLSEKNN